MLTLQILDGNGETFYYPLDEGGDVTIGSAADVEVRLSEPGVAPRHARIQPVTGRKPGFKVVDLGSPSGTRVNGEPVLQARLALGDRIELGRSAVVVGQRVSRPATAGDVLERASIPSRSVRSARPPSRRPQWAWIGGAVAVGLAICIVLFTRGGDDALPSYHTEVSRQAELGEFEAAHRWVARLRDEWAGTDDARQARVDGLDRSVRDLERAVVDGRKRIRREAATQKRAQQFRDLREAMKERPDTVEGRAARILLTELDSLRDGVESLPRTFDLVAQPDSGEAEADSDEDVSDASRAGGEVVAARDADVPSFDLDAVLAEARRLRDSGDTAAALRALEDGRSQASSEAEQAQLDVMKGLLRDMVQDELETRLARARQLSAAGTVSAIDRAISSLRSHADRLPPALVGDVIERELARLRGSRQAAERVRAAKSGVASLDEVLASARQAEENGKLDEAAALTEAASKRAAENNDPAFAAELAGRVAELTALAALESHLVIRARATQGVLELPTRDGQRLRLHAADGRRLTTVDGDGPTPWADLLVARVLSHVQDADAPPAAVLGAAVLAYRGQQRALAEGLLAQHAAREDLESAALTRVIARGRGDRFVDARGYRLVDGQFVSVRELDSREVAARVATAIAGAIKRDQKSRDSALEKILAEGPQVTDAVVLELRRQLEEYVEKIAANRFKTRVWDELAAKRAELDERRDFALELIFDTDRYFYPYKPPAVSAERAAEYRRVQAEVDERVAAVEELWDRGTSGKRLPGALTKDIERLAWIRTTLADFGQSDEAMTQSVEWVFTLPTESEPLSLRNFCLTPAERLARDESERIHAYNDGLEILKKGEAEQVRITNAYRELLGRAPVAISLELLESSRGHAEEMSRLGYFSHYSPTPGRESPYDRMRLAGYDQGNSENLAQHPSAQSAHDGWTHSSGHHRNLLGPNHTEFGIGQDGRHWVQNFGSGRTYRARY